MSKPPIITHRPPEPLQDYYRDSKGNLYSVARMIDEAKDLKPFDVPIAALPLDGVIWYNESIYNLAYHCKRVNKADLSKPIILDWHGNLADGRHRLIKAIVEGKRTIKAVRITWVMTPCKPSEEV